MRLVVSLLWCLAMGTLTVAAQSVNSMTPLQFVPLQTPCRAVDTRLTGGPIAAGTSQNFNPAGGECNIPSQGSGPIAYALNVTVVPRGPLGYLTVWPTGEPQPVVSTLNSDGIVKANAAIVAGGNGGLVSIYASDTTDLVLDVSGYFISSTADYVYVPITPCRVVDTRINNGGFGAPSLVAGQQRAFELANSSCNLPASVFSSGGALAFNVTVVPIGGHPVSYLTAWGTSPNEPQTPLTSTLNITTGMVTANAALISINPSTSGSVSVYATDNTDLVLDVSGYFVPASQAASGLSLYTLPPCRVLDTRLSSGELKGQLKVPVTTGNNCNVPSSGQAYVMNATVVPAAPLGFLTLWPDTISQPVASTLNADDGVVTSNMAIVSSPNGSVDAFASSATQLILDVSAYFAPTPGFTLSTTPPNGYMTVEPGGTVTFSLLASAVNGFTGDVQATLSGSTGLTVTPSTLNLVPGVAQTITVSASSSATSGAVSIAANAGSISQSLSESITVGPNFSIPQYGDLQLGGYVDGGFVVTPQPGFEGTVSAQITGFPPGVLVGTSPVPSPPYFGGGNPMYLTGNCLEAGGLCQPTYFEIVYAGAAAGTYPLTLTATSGTITHTESISLVVTPPNFNVSVTPANVTLTPGGTQTVNLSVSAYGASSNVNVVVANLPAGVTASPDWNIESSTPVVLTASPSAVPGTYVVTVGGNDTITTDNGYKPPVPPLYANTQFTLTILPSP
jgi:hypothetical protein